jgi:cytochrome c oxidase subunit 4
MSHPTPPTHATAHGTTADDPHGIRSHADNTGLLIVVWIVVLGLALANVGISTAIGPTKFTLPLQLAIASVQAGIVAYYFMHLRQGDRVVVLTALSSLFWMGILFVLFLADYLTRHLVVGGGS